VELLSPAAMADPSSIWTEHTRADGFTYNHNKVNHNKVTKESTWTVPQELKAAQKGHAQWAAVVPAAGKRGWLCFCGLLSGHLEVASAAFAHQFVCGMTASECPAACR
jgi:hypothetical protein